LLNSNTQMPKVVNIRTLRKLLKVAEKEIKEFNVYFYDKLIPQLLTMDHITAGQVAFLRDFHFEDDDEFIDFMKTIMHHDGYFIDNVDVVVDKWVDMKKAQQVFASMPRIYDVEIQKLNARREDFQANNDDDSSNGCSDSSSE